MQYIRCPVAGAHFQALQEHRPDTRQSTKGGFLCPLHIFKAHFRLLSSYPYISTLTPFQARFTHFHALLQGASDTD